MLTLVLQFLAASQLLAASQVPLGDDVGPPWLDEDPIPLSTRAHWMRKANEALKLLDSPCPFQAFGTVIVNHTAHTADGLGTLVCMGINQIVQTGNPTLHGTTAWLAKI